ncbi:MAG: MarR family EPS-associated transcriptional regulator [Pseudomonadota bacterium]
MQPKQELNQRDVVAYKVLRSLEKHPDATQRDIAGLSRVSLGAVNYCLRALQEKGLVKVKNFRASGNKKRYAYILTPKGLAEKAVLAQAFLKRKLVEYEKIQNEIEEIEAELKISKSQP